MEDTDNVGDGELEVEGVTTLVVGIGDREGEREVESVTIRVVG